MNVSHAPVESAPIKVSGILAWIAATCLVANIVQVLCDSCRTHILAPWLVIAALSALGVIALLQIWINQRAYRKAVTSIHFGVAMITALAIATITGTIVVQTANQAVFFARYGPAAPAMTWLHLHDIFHSAWFEWLLVLFAIGLIGSIAHRKAWKWREFGFMLTHCGAILLLIGGAIDLTCGNSGVVHLQIGESSGKYVQGDGRNVRLPFQVSLDRFQVDRREPQFRLYVMERRGDDWGVTESFNPSEQPSLAVAGFGKIEVISFRKQSGSDGHDSRDAPVNATVQLRMRGPDGIVKEVELQGTGQSSVSLGADDARELRFGKKSDDISNFVSTLSIMQDGQAVLTRDVRVNHPLHFQGYSFYQASYDPKNPRYSGILVVRQPGLTLAFIGLASILAGIIHILVLRPRIGKRESAA